MGIRSYYNFAELFSRNGTYNFVVGGRGLGKTFGAKKKIVNDAIRKGEQFIYLRRYKDEVSSSRDTFFDDLIAEGLFPNHMFKINESKAYWAKAIPGVDDMDVKDRKAAMKDADWKLAGHFMALSTAQQKKSVAYPLVTTILYDEFIIEKGMVQYLPNEAVAFNNFYSTVDRWKDKTRVIFLANAVSVSNPYFTHYKIRPDESSEWVIAYNNFIVAHFPDSEKFRNEVYQTAFGKFIAGTNYAEYAVGNNFADNHDNLIDGKPSSAVYVFSLECKTGTFSVWSDMKRAEFYIQEKRPRIENLYTMVPEKMSEEKILMSFSDKPLGMLRTAFRQAKVNFDMPATRNTFTEIFSR